MAARALSKGSGTLRLSFPQLQPTSSAMPASSESSSLRGPSPEHQSESACSSSRSFPQPRQDIPELNPFASLSNSLSSSAILSHSPSISSYDEHRHSKRHCATEKPLRNQADEQEASQTSHNRNLAQNSVEALRNGEELPLDDALEADDELRADDELGIDSEFETDEELESEDEEVFEQQLASGVVESEAKRLKEVVEACIEGGMSGRSIERVLKARPLLCKCSYQSIARWVKKESAAQSSRHFMCPDGHMAMRAESEECKVEGCRKRPAPSTSFWHFSIIGQLQALAGAQTSFEQLRRGQRRALESLQTSASATYNDYYDGDLFRSSFGGIAQHARSDDELIVHLRLTTDGVKIFEGRRKQKSATANHADALKMLPR